MLVKYKWLFIALIVALTAVGSLPVLNAKYVTPHFTNYITTTTEKDAIIVASHLKDVFFEGYTTLAAETFNEQLKADLQKDRFEHNLLKIKVFSDDGTLLHSTNASDSHNASDPRFFEGVIKNQSPYSAMKQKGQKSLEGEEVDHYYVETYVPIVAANRSIGAFEIYIDISSKMKRFEEVRRSAFYSGLSITALLVLALGIGLVMAGLNIKNRHKAEEALKASEQKFALAFRASPNWMSISTLDEGRYVDVNDAFLRALNLKRIDVIGSTSRALNIWQADAQREEMVAELKRSGEFRNREVAMSDSNGRQLTMLASAEMVTIDKAPCVLNVRQDITELRAANEALQESKEIYKNVIDNIGVGVALIGRDMKVLGLNRQMKEWRRNGRPSEGDFCYKELNDPPRHSVCPGCPSRKTIRDGNQHETTVEVKDIFGNRHFRHLASPIKKPDGSVAAVVEIVDDVTEYQQLNEELEINQRLLYLVLEHVPVGVLVFDAKGTPYFSNKVSRQMFAKENQPLIDLEDLFNTAYITDSFEPYPREKLPIMRALRGVASSANDVSLRIENRTVAVEMQAQPIYDHKGKRVLTVAMLQELNRG